MNTMNGQEKGNGDIDELLLGQPQQIKSLDSQAEERLNEKVSF